ncbi:hypothetical protein TNCV_655491 [Trichonephila clavipes]|nr:hypothetical protein TNCV_655491 [Trichonephila clavipes]
MTHISVVRIDDILSADRDISDILHPVVVPYRRRMSARSPDLSPIENIWSWVTDRIAPHPSPTKTVDEVWHRLKATWNELPLSVTQAQFDSMLNWERFAVSDFPNFFSPRKSQNCEELDIDSTSSQKSLLPISLIWACLTKQFLRGNHKITTVTAAASYFLPKFSTYYQLEEEVYDPGLYIRAKQGRLIPSLI